MHSVRWSVWYAVGLILLAVWLHRAWLIVHDTGLFRVVGLDWALYAAQALILRSDEPQSIYTLDKIDSTLQALRIYTANPWEPLAVGPVPYPPVFALLVSPFTLLPPPVGFGLWTLFNLAGAMYLAKRVADVLPTAGLPRAALALLISVPIAQGLIVGQPTSLLGCAMAECYLSLRAGHDLRGGLWLAALLFKPQYGILLGPVLIWKRRWSAVLGVGLGGSLILVASIVLVGVPTLLSYLAALSYDAQFHGGALSSPGLMLNWRALILNLRPSIGAETGLLLTLVLSAITVLCSLPIWRGVWAPGSSSFPARISITLLATVLANYHSHVHGAAILAVPLAATLGQLQTGTVARWAVVALIFVPTVLLVALQHWLVHMLILHQPLDTLIWSPVVQVLLTLALVSLVVDVFRARRCASRSANDPPGRHT